MASSRPRRDVLRAVGSTLLIATAGCGRLPGRSGPQPGSSTGTTVYDAVVAGQPTIGDGVPAVWGVIVAHPDVARKLIDWGALTPRAGDAGPGVAFRTFDPATQFLTVVGGVLPTGDALAGYDDPGTLLGDVVDDFSDHSAFDDGRIRYEVTPYRAFVPDPGVPDAHYDYTFTLWNRRGHDLPEEISVTLHARSSA